MSRLPLTPEQAELSDRIYQTLRQATDSDLRSLAELLASKPDRQLLGQTEFEVRDRVHQIGAKALADRSGRAEKRGYQGSSLSCPHCHESARFVEISAQDGPESGRDVPAGTGLLPLPVLRHGHGPLG